MYKRQQPILRTDSQLEKRLTLPPTDFKGMFVFGRNKYPLSINLSTQPRKEGNTSNVSLSGLTNSDSVGVAVVQRDTITIRLLDDSANITVLTLRRQASPEKQTVPEVVQPRFGCGVF